MVQRSIIADDHQFVSRIFELAAPPQLWLSNKQLNGFPDYIYVMNVYWRLVFLIERVESLNLVRKVLVTQKLPRSFRDFPVSRYEWLTIAADVFLMRFVSAFDCCLLLANEVFECDLAPQECRLSSLQKKGVPPNTLKLLKALSTTNSPLRDERNTRFHRGWSVHLQGMIQSFELCLRWRP